MNGLGGGRGDIFYTENLTRLPPREDGGGGGGGGSGVSHRNRKTSIESTCSSPCERPPKGYSDVIINRALFI